MIFQNLDQNWSSSGGWSKAERQSKIKGELMFSLGYLPVCLNVEKMCLIAVKKLG